MWVAKYQLQGRGYASISLVTMWISNCSLKYEQYKYTSYIISRVSMLNSIMYTLHYYNGTHGPVVHTLHYCNGTSVWSSCPHTLHYCNGTHVVLLPKQCIIARTHPCGPAIHIHSVITMAHMCGPAVYTPHYCNGTYVWSSCPHTALMQWHMHVV